jgi:predicted O-methyltransferase YrrM
MVSTLLQPKRILEIGSFTGYSAICLGRGLAPDGTMDALELNPELAEIFHRHIAAAGLQDKITLHNGDARQIFPKLKGPYDIIFIDAGKQEYPEYYQAAVDLSRKNGLILIDNMLWEGKVFGETDDADAIVIRELGKTLLKDKRVEVVMLPLRDGITMVRKL